MVLRAYVWMVLYGRAAVLGPGCLVGWLLWVKKNGEGRGGGYWVALFQGVELVGLKDLVRQQFDA